MAKSISKTYMTRRGRRYLIERKQDGTFGKFIPISKPKAKEVKKAKTTDTSPNTLVA
ncbi:MAG: hypothetical protein FD167_4243 [bacterium]|nr:MAG: hypothetical protein FD167_4243 [bacterium]